MSSTHNCPLSDDINPSEEMSVAPSPLGEASPAPKPSAEPLAIESQYSEMRSSSPVSATKSSKQNIGRRFCSLTSKTLRAVRRKSSPKRSEATIEKKDEKERLRALKREREERSKQVDKERRRWRREKIKEVEGWSRWGRVVQDVWFWGLL